MYRRNFILSAMSIPALPCMGRAQDGSIRLRDLYAKSGDLSELAQSSLGERILVDGFMAPPLKAEADFFVLTKMPMAVCPFCETSAEWPDDIVAVFTKRMVRVVPFNVGIEVRGVLEYGEKRDEETGFVSMLRLTDATYG
ncbi:hypothetical protein LX81_01557 [Palleronia aestuarii]|uniref:DUF3299 domain-containing protein n=1 Tax=Palleronia aestuarii TaxID=568105 RepID=A0A2W7NFH9_9RHOB|nr:hypothetical protein [Palleronia aestuarii]PZX16927.1 hypothetical protein LX81_01557 [Palleronia aestuarii]